MSTLQYSGPIDVFDAIRCAACFSLQLALFIREWTSHIVSFIGTILLVATWL